MNITVFCSSKENLNSIYYDEVEKLFNLLDNNKITIIYGGGTMGLMGKVRKIWQKNNGKIISSNITQFTEAEIIDDYVFDNIIDRQKKLVELGDCYLILPGGYGTTYEALEVITKNDIGEALKPIFILNINNIFTNLINHIEKLKNEGFITRDLEKLKVVISSNINELANQINSII